MNNYKNNPHVRKWLKARIPYGYYQDYLRQKEEPYDLSVIDLLFISNFKGGNGAIREKTDILKKKLLLYSKKLSDIDEKYKSKIVNNFSDSDLTNWIKDGEDFLSLAIKSDSKIDGFGPSYASALLNSHFPDLFPIIDRRVLSGSGISIFSDSNENGVETYSSNGQVKNIEKHYGWLMRFVHQKLLDDNPTTIGCIDLELFSKDLRKEFKKQTQQSPKQP
ncbi:MAG: hypothetical protein WC762_01000 [Methylobacter sp.]|jgi:hypothetical protein